MELERRLANDVDALQSTFFQMQDLELCVIVPIDETCTAGPAEHVLSRLSMQAPSLPDCAT